MKRKLTGCSKLWMLRSAAALTAAALSGRLAVALEAGATYAPAAWYRFENASDFGVDSSQFGRDFGTGKRTVYRAPTHKVCGPVGGFLSFGSDTEAPVPLKCVSIHRLRHTGALTGGLLHSGPHACARVGWTANTSARYAAFFAS